MTMRHHVSRLAGSGQNGFTMVSAIFLLVVLAGLGAAMVNISSSQHTSSALDVQGSRAYQAARAGIEWGVYKVVNASACFTSPSSFKPQAATLSDFTVTVTCTGIPSASAGITVYQIRSTACNQPGASGCPGAAGSTFYVERQIQVTL